MTDAAAKPFRLGTWAPADRSHLLATLALAALAVAALLSVGWSVYHGLGADGGRDLQWSGAHLLWLGRDPYERFLICRLAGCADDPFLFAQFPNYPISSLAMFAPLGALPWDIAKPVWIAITLASTLALLWSARRDLAPDLDGRLLLGAFFVFLLSVPFRNHVSNGQEALFSLAAFSLALAAGRRGYATLTGLLLALAWFKFTLTLPLSLVFVARRDWRAIAVAAAIHLVLALWAGWWIGRGLLETTAGFFAVADLAVVRTFGFLDVFGIALHLGLPDWVAPALSLAAAAAALYLALRLREGQEQLLMAVTSLLALAAFYHLSYDGVILLLPLLYALGVFTRRGRARGELVFAILIVASVAIAWFVNRMIEGNNVGYAFGGYGYRHYTFWVLAAIYYAAIGAGLYQLWKMRANLTWRDIFAAKRGPRATR